MFKKKYLMIAISFSLTTATLHANNCNVKFDLKNEWNSGFVVDVYLQNKSQSTINNWQITWQNAQFSINNIWRAKLNSTNNQTLHIDHENYNSQIPINGEEHFGFVGSGEFNLPSYFSINNMPCSINGASNQEPEPEPEEDTEAPGNPIISVSNISESSIQLNWDLVSDNVTANNQIKYEIFVNDQLKNTQTGNNYLINNLSPNTNYSLYIKAVDESNNKSQSNNLNIKTLASTPQACNYDVNQDQFNLVNEYQTTAISGWYTDYAYSPITTVNNKTYFVYVKPNSTASVGVLNQGIVQEYDLDNSFTISNDAHNEFSIGVDKNGYIHIVGGMHNNSLNYWRSTKPYDISQFERHFNEIDGDTFTYLFMRNDNNGELYMVTRARGTSLWYKKGGRGLGLYHYNTHGVFMSNI